jgi:chemotaxis protein methyltransferase CheR
MLESRLRRRVRALGLNNLSEYGDAIFDEGRLSEEFDHVVDCATTNKTDFFREPEHFVFLREHAIPTLLQRANGREGALKFWSAAASNGAEAYTIAMVAAEALGLNLRAFSVLGTDINSEVIAEARRAIYPAAFADPIPRALRDRYLMVSRDAGRLEIRIAPELRRTVRFETLNLMDARYPVDQDLDVIFCRNVLIYFTKATQDAVLRRLCGHLRMGGHLILGHSESLAGNDQPALRQVAPTIFRRVG